MLQGQIDYSLGEATRRRFAYESAGYQVPEVSVDFLGTYVKPVTPATGAPPAVAGAQPNIEAEARRAFGSYDPNTYTYGFENGRFYRDKK